MVLLTQIIQCGLIVIFTIPIWAFVIGMFGLLYTAIKEGNTQW